MPSRILTSLAILLATTLPLMVGGCGEDEARTPDTRLEGLEGLEGDVRALAAADRPDDLAEVVIDYPLDESVFPPEIVSPTFLWHDTAEGANAWLVEVAFGEDGGPLRVLVPGVSPPLGEIDPETIGPTNEVYRGTPYRQSSRSWTPSPDVWAQIKRRSVRKKAVVTILGFRTDDPVRPLSQGRISITTSEDPVGAPIFYRDVPLMPNAGESGEITPLAKNAFPTIAWRLRDLSKPRSTLLLSGMPSCANCHSFSLDGRTLAMDVDGPQGDKGTYAIAPIARNTVIRPENVITWNSFPDKPEGHKTIGFLSRISPDAKYALTTLNESLYVANFTDYKFLQVFYPTRGILAWYSTETGEMKALPGADDERYVHTNGVWTPDGKEIVFSRAEAFDPYEAGQAMATYATDPNEPRIRYNLYRMPFNEGKGGTPVPIQGASHNGMSNTFPKVSPDGKWIVFTQCRNGQLMRPDGRLWIVPLEGGTAREMRCNTSRMNSWHSFSPNGRWMVFSSKVDTPYTQMFLTHIDEDGGDSPRILVPDSTAANRAVNIPEFVNTAYDDFTRIEVPAVNHHHHLAVGIELLEADRIHEAIAELEKALALEPDFSRAHTKLAIALTHLERYDEAVQHLEQALRVNTENAFTWNALGNARIGQGRSDKALESFRRALAISPVNPFTHNDMGMAMQQLGRPKEAVKHFRRAVELYPTFVEALENLGYVLLEQGLLDEALEAYRKAIELAPDDAVAHSSASRILLQQGHFEKALAHLERTVDLAPEDVQARISLAWQLATLPDDGVRSGERAVEVATEACELTAWDQPGPLDVLAAAYAEAGRFGEAVDAAKRALTLAKAGRGPVAGGIEKRLALYEAGRPYRQSKR